ncbi:hypothetical protein AQUCO_01000398v1 [Aquilegia coerulea]|uniref:POX domain-containing protein n=1 Tax=Aquilegia coerulea TaxID=218851 RepID=A0A2G5E9S8_AQUCA|nr:hypothetical protein AQUCO_01000398v1 [Aquilegia coerulea]
MRATTLPPPLFILNTQKSTNSVVKSMSKGFNHQGINISFSSNEFQDHQLQQQQQSHITQQGRRDKLRVQAAGGFDAPPASLVAIEPEEEEVPGGGGMAPVYETSGMWSDMFNYQSGGTTSTSTEFLENQISSSNYHRLHHREAAVAPPVGVVANEWYGNRQGMVGGFGMGPLGDSKQQTNNSDNRDSNIIAQNHQISSLNADSAAAMQLFLMNPQPRSPSPSPTTTSSTPLHLLLPNQQQSSSHHSNLQQHFHNSAAAAFANSPASQFQWVSSSSSSGVGNNTAAQTQLNKIGTAIENQGLSLTLSTSLQHLEAAKAEEFRMGEDGVFYYDQGSGIGGGSGSSSSASVAFQLKNYIPHNQAIHLQGIVNQNQMMNTAGLRSPIGVMSLLRNSKYSKAAQELLEEFCSVGRGHLKKHRSLARNNSINQASTASFGGGGGGGNGSSSSSKELTSLSAADRIDHQRKKTKLLSMLDEVDRRYNHYCEQMQVVVNSFDSVMGFGSATPYTALAQKAMSRHFRCLKDAITTQLKQTCELLGEKDSAGVSGVTKGETPRLKLLEQSLRQQRAFHQMGMMEQEAWRPQRGLPERSVNILRAWLFEHFLHPYPSDADKHLLARQTGLSRNQVHPFTIFILLKRNIIQTCES